MLTILKLFRNLHTKQTNKQTNKKKLKSQLSKKPEKQIQLVNYGTWEEINTANENENCLWTFISVPLKRAF